MKKLILTIAFVFAIVALIAQNNNKVTICHFSPGHPEGKTIVVNANAVDVFLANGDHLGACECDRIIDLKAYPNPYPDQVTIDFDLQKESYTSIEVYDQHGTKVHTIEKGNKPPGKYTYHFSAKSIGYSTGIYLVHAEAISDTDHATESVVIVEE